MDENVREFSISVGRSRNEMHWRNQTISWEGLKHRLSEVCRTAETVAEFRKMSKADQAEKKDVGGFVGGHLADGRRKAGSVLFRSLITLDMDYGKPDAWERFALMMPYAAAMYSTHSHRPEAPRFRFVIPTDRDMGPVEYEATARMVAKDLGIELFDDTTYQAERLMYWPSASKDAEYIYRYQDGPWLSVDEVLARYKDYHNTAEWPISNRVDSVIRKEMTKQGDPLEKGGLIGAFCRSYDIHEAIETFLAEDYTACEGAPGRYTYTKGSTAAGLVTYEDKFAYSHHSTDPSCGKLCNAFDLVRIHLFGDKDEDWRGKDITKAPSYVAMTGLASGDKKVRGVLAKERLAEAKEDFAGIAEEDMDWMAELDTDKNGKLKNTPGNFEMVLVNDPNIKGKIALDEFTGRISVRGPLPWREPGDDDPLFRDDDESGLFLYVSKAPYELDSKGKLQEALRCVVRQNAYHPVREYFNGLQWDGKERLDTLFVDYLGVEDCEYTRAATRKSLTAAVTRIFHPGAKFDYMIVLVGAQGIGKSRLLARLAVNPVWFADNFSVDGKEAAENIQGKLLVEAAELSGFKKSESTAVKAFITRTNDYYRAAYDRYAQNRPRQCVFIGTTNEYRFLRDETGDRRFWPMETRRPNITKDFKDLTDYEVGQIWAEAVKRYRDGEQLYLPPEIEAVAAQKQAEFTEVETRIGIIQAYLDTLLPEGWNKKSIEDRIKWLEFNSDGQEIVEKGCIIRDKVCVQEIWCECFGRPRGLIKRTDSNDIAKIMAKVPGWRNSGRAAKMGPYGAQMVFVREDI